jgi:hypothetical protein
MATATDEVTKVLPAIDDDITEWDGQSHYVRIKSLVKGGPQVALCGKKWLPHTIIDAEKYPTCKACEELIGLIQSMDG